MQDNVPYSARERIQYILRPGELSLHIISVEVPDFRMSWKTFNAAVTFLQLYCETFGCSLLPTWSGFAMLKMQVVRRLVGSVHVNLCVGTPLSHLHFHLCSR